MDYKQVIESRYDRSAWLALLHDIFQNKAKPWVVPQPVVVSSHLARKALNIGKITLADGNVIAVYEVELSDSVDIERNRRGIRDMLTSDWRNLGYAGAFMFCYRAGESVLRFSYVSESWGFNSKGEYEKFSTATKRYTYLLGEGRGCRTAVEQFTALKQSKQTLSDVTEAFSVEALTKQFYKDLFDWYQWAIDPASSVTFPNDTAIEEDDREDLETKVIRLITRIMFVWYIKQNELVPNRLFDVNFLATILKDFDPYSATVGNYYNAILQNLFFATLNREIESEKGVKRHFATATKRDVKNLYRYAEMFSISEDEVINLFAEVPFLNGGLFECLDKTVTIDGVEQAYNFDGFSRNDRCFADGRYRYRAVVPNNLFFDRERGLISILSRYNFTIEENSPEEQQVALDPELLGKVFENLLGAYNPETKETARNQSGSFYTPREIVNYMVDESLIAYLGDTPAVRDMFEPDFMPDKTKEEEYRGIIARLKAVKVLDPACGSGAFPMGLLNRIIDIVSRVSPEENNYELKLHIIENCLYGSDKQSIAAQITKLRFFISLICDCHKDASKPNFGIPTLPNLETKFVTADSLITVKKQDILGNLFEDPEIQTTKEALRDVRHQHFMAKSASTKRRLRDKDQELRERLAQLLEANKDFAPEDARQLAAWNPYDQNTVCQFFDPEWMYGLTEGFDIVIGNPPYIQLQNDGGKLAAKYYPFSYNTFARTGDIYCLFYERGWQLLRNGGHLCFITSNKWMRAGYGEKLRGFFAAKTDPQLLIDFGGVKIFESATVDTNILLFEKGANRHSTRCAVTNRQNKDSVKNLSVFMRQQSTVSDFSTADSWVVLSPIEQAIKRKIEAVGTPLRDWDIQIYRGVLTGCNEAFIIDSRKRDEILSNCQTEDERSRTDDLIRPILRGRDIKRYGYDWAGLYLIWVPWHFPYHLDKSITGASPIAEKAFSSLYSSVYQHLLQYKPQLEKRNKAETGIRYEWYALQRWGANYWDLFFQPKICWKAVGRNLSFAIVKEGIFLTAPASFISAGKLNKYILACLHSEIGKYYIYKYSDTTGAGDIMLNIQSLIKMPIPTQFDLDYIELILSKPNYEELINLYIKQLYGLNQEEWNYICIYKK